MSSPKIALHKKNVKMEEAKSKHVKRTQKDYSMSFKLQVVSEIENGELSITGSLRKYGIQSHGTVLNWCRKFGSLDREYQVRSTMTKTPEQRILELEQKVRLLEKQKKTLEKQVEHSDEKAIFFDMMIDIAEKEFKIPIRKKHLPKQLSDIQNPGKNQ